MRAAVHFGPPRAYATFVSEGAALIFATSDPHTVVRPSREETSLDAPLHRLSLPVANFAINLGPLVSPVQQGEMNELFVKWKSSQA
jgi:hypothetical protein